MEKGLQSEIIQILSDVVFDVTLLFLKLICLLSYMGIRVDTAA
jgi:hypothetical protein